MSSPTMAEIDAVVLNFSETNIHILNAVLAIVTLSIAIDLKIDDFRKIVQTPKPVIVGLVSQFILLPLSTFLLIIAVNPQPSLALGLILIAACPGGIISNYITHRAGGNSALSVSLTAFSSVGAIVLTPFNIALLGNLYPPTRELLRKTAIDPMSVFITIGLVLVLPMCLGILLNQRHPAVTARMRRPMKYLSGGIFGAFVILALAANWGLFIKYAGILIGLVVSHNALALFGGFALSSVLGLSAYDRRAVTIETGIQNGGLGLVLTFGFFNGLGGMAMIVALWGVWLLISGVFAAAIMSRTNVRPIEIRNP